MVGKYFMLEYLLEVELHGIYAFLNIKTENSMELKVCVEKRMLEKIRNIANFVW